MNKFNSYFVFIFAVIFTALAVANIPSLAQHFSGAGTEATPYLINTRADMDTLVKYVEDGSGWTAGKYFRLQNDIGSVFAPWTNPIGSDNVPFQGHLDGNNKTVYINIVNTVLHEPTGFFRKILNGSVKNLRMQGSVVGHNSVGGIVGEMRDGTLENCTNLAAVSGIAFVGGIVGRFFYQVSSTGIMGCLNIGTVTAQEFVGGICGINSENILIDRCINQGGVNATVSTAGGIIGVNHSSVTQSINLGIVQGNTAIGGIVGKNGFSVINPTITTHCINAGIVQGAGICGANGGQITHCINVGCASGSAIVSINSIADPPTSGTVTHCYYDKQFTMVGGINGADVTGSAEGKLTSEMIGTVLSNPLSPILGTTWIYPANKYPVISVLSTNDYAIVASSPVFFDDAATTRLTIDKNFTADITNGVSWNSSFNKVTFDNSTGRSTISLLFADTLNCTRVDARKIIPINILNVPVEKLYNVIVEAWPTAGGEVTGGGSYDPGEVATITATANPNYRFAHWEDLPSGVNFSTSQEHNVTINRDSRFRAHFYIDSFSLSLTATPSYMGFAFGTGLYPYGYNAKFYAVPHYGYHFVKWINETGDVYTDLDTGHITITEARHFTAHFEIDTFKIKVSVDPFSYGVATVNGEEEGEYVYLTELEISTKGHDTCFHFIKWTAFGDTTAISTELDFILTLTADTHIVAHYTETNRKVIL